MTPRRLAVVTTHPIQYQAPVWRGLAATPGLDVHVYFGSDHSVRGYRDPGFGVEFKWDVPVLDGYPHTLLSTGPKTAGADNFFLRAGFGAVPPPDILPAGLCAHYCVHSLLLVGGTRGA